MKNILIFLLLFSVCVTVAFTALADKPHSGNGFIQTDDEIMTALLEHFKKLAAIPRPSGHTEKISKYLYDYAAEKGLKAKQDKAGNVIVDIPATNGLEKLPKVILQGHMDMVCVSDHDGYAPEKTPIEVIRDGNIIRANGTSLGADDGIGVAMILCVMDGLTPHGPIRAIFTADEETTLNGAKNIDRSSLEDCRYLINIDGEESDSVYLGCSSCCNTTLKSPQKVEAPHGDLSVTIRVGGLKGGHSAVMIGSHRLSAISALCVLLSVLRDNELSFDLASFHGGDAFNAIPKSAECRLVISAKDAEKYKSLIGRYQQHLRNICKDSDPDLSISFTPDSSLPEKVLTEIGLNKIIDACNLLLHGVLTMENLSKNQVAISANLGILDAAPDDGLTIVSCLRSNTKAGTESMLTIEQAFADLNGFSFEINDDSGAWEYAKINPLRDLYGDSYKKFTGRLPEMVTTHANLECASFIKTAPGLSMIAIGPDVTDPHSTHESCDLGSAVKIWRALSETLQHIDRCEEQNESPADTASSDAV